METRETGCTMIAIEVKFLGPTNNKGSRYKAYTCNGQHLTKSANYSLNADENAESVAYELRDKAGWKGKLVGGGTVKGWTFVFVS